MNARLCEFQGRNKSQAPSGYTRILGNEALGNVISKVQATVIAAGND